MPHPSEDRIQPCLFDRLIDDHPESEKDSRAERLISLKRYREGVLRDLAWLLNAKAHLETEDINLFGQAAGSVINFGVPDLCGHLTSGLDLGKIEAQIMEAIGRYEQRIIPNTLVVKTVESDPKSGPSTIAFEIRGDLWASPVPEQLYIKTQIDLETGQCVL